MGKIKNLVYLDEYKMYSISAQMFEGVTESLVGYKGNSLKQKEKQKGEDDSGQELSDIFSLESGIQEKKYLHDYAYCHFEEHLENSDNLFNIDTERIEDSIKQIQTPSFVKIKSRVIFNDIKKVKSVIEKFNDLGEAIAYIGHIHEMEGTSESNRNRKSTNSKNFARNLARELGLYQDKDFLEKLALILDFGFHDQFRVMMDFGKYSFGADCNRNYLRENESSLIRKYSRFPKTEFVLVGIITQGIGEYIKHKSEHYSSVNIKENILFMTEALSDIESEFSGKLENEIVIDPIAIYTELSAVK